MKMRRLDGGKNNPRFSCLGFELLSVEGPKAGVLLFQELILVMRGINHGVVEASMQHVRKALENKAVIANLVKAPAAYMYQVWSATYSMCTVKSLMDDFTTEAALVSSNSTFD